MREDLNLPQQDLFMVTEDLCNVQMWRMGHVACECPMVENLDWRGLMWADPTPEKAPGPESTMPNQQ